MEFKKEIENVVIDIGINILTNYLSKVIIEEITSPYRDRQTYRRRFRSRLECKYLGEIRRLKRTEIIK